ncbi:MAG: hypothetical protein GXP15_16120 [Gammaproteobacteria bacterium]|nr:hypothetical protein [Gammaproteobacteria bacterium]
MITVLHAQPVDVVVTFHIGDDDLASFGTDQFGREKQPLLTLSQAE